MCIFNKHWRSGVIFSVPQWPTASPRVPLTVKHPLDAGVGWKEMRSSYIREEPAPLLRGTVLI